MSELSFRPCDCGNTDIHINRVLNRRGTAYVFTAQCPVCLQKSPAFYAMYTGEFATAELRAAAAWNRGIRMPGGCK